MNSRISWRNTLLLLAGLLFALQGMSQDLAAASHRAHSAAGATVGFANLADGDVVPPVFTVKFAISGMDIAPAGTQTENSGHHHLLIDVAELPDMNLPLPATDNIRHFGKGQTEVEITLPEGSHTLQLLLGDYVHIPHSPPVMSGKITITVKAAAAD
jgi:hypothetical protein